MAMDKQLKELVAFLSDGEKFDLPSYKELPQVELYMEQVIGYVNDVLRPFSSQDKKALTSFMVNNYVKAGMIKEPKKKRYSQEHLGYLLAISILKETLSMNNISLLIDMDKNVSLDKGRLYAFFTSLEEDILHNVDSSVKQKVDGLARRYEAEKATDEKKADENLNNSLGLIALRLAVEAQVYKLISDRILVAIASGVYDEKSLQTETTPRHDETRRAKEIQVSEAQRLALAKKERKKGE